MNISQLMISALMMTAVAAKATAAGIGFGQDQSMDPANALAQARAEASKTKTAPPTVVATDNGLVITAGIGQCWQRATQAADLKGLTIPPVSFAAAFPEIFCVDAVSVLARITSDRDNEPMITVSGTLGGKTFKATDKYWIFEDGDHRWSNGEKWLSVTVKSDKLDTGVADTLHRGRFSGYITQVWVKVNQSGIADPSSVEIHSSVWIPVDYDGDLRAIVYQKK